MTDPVSLADIKVHLRLPAEETDEDAYLQAMIVAARRTVEVSINCQLADLADDDVVVVGHAVRLIVGGWYANREAAVTGAAVAELPIGVSFLLKPLRRMPSPALPA